MADCDPVRVGIVLCDVAKILNFWFQSPVPLVFLEKLVLVEFAREPCQYWLEAASVSTYPE